MASYIVASSKDWHKEAYEKFAASESGNWMWTSTPQELALAIDKETPRYIFFLHWSWIVPAEVWANIECVCFHMTDLPYGRGGSPLQNLIESGHKTTMLSAIRMEEEVDAGPVYLKRPLSLDGRAEEIYLRAGKICWNMVSWILENSPQPEAQVGTPTYFKRRTPGQSLLPDTGSLELVFDHIRMLDAPTYPLAYLDHGEFRLEFSNASLTGDELSAQVVLKPKASSEKTES